MEQIRKQITETTPILSNYFIRDDTYIIIPAMHTHYDSIAVANSGVYPIRQTPSEVLKHTCSNGSYDFESKKRQSELYFDNGYKLPLSLREDMILIAFPTKGMKQIHCAWIIERNIKYIYKHNNDNDSVIMFKNGLKIILDISYDILKNQCRKALDFQNYIYFSYMNMHDRVMEGKEKFRGDIADYMR